MFGIIDENKKFILLDSDHDRLRITALMLAKEELLEVDEVSINGEIIKKQGDTHWVSMFDENTVDEAIKEYAENDIEKAYTGEYYLAGFAPQQPVEEKNEAIKQTRANLYAELIDPLHAQKTKDIIMDEWSDEKEQEYVAKVKELTIKIRDENPYIDIE